MHLLSHKIFLVSLKDILLLVLLRHGLGKRSQSHIVYQDIWKVEHFSICLMDLRLWVVISITPLFMQKHIERPEIIIVCLRLEQPQGARVLSMWVALFKRLHAKLGRYRFKLERFCLRTNSCHHLHMLSDHLHKMPVAILPGVLYWALIKNKNVH